MRFAELVSHRIFERKWRSREILRARLFEGPFIRLNFGFVYELWHFVVCVLSGTMRANKPVLGGPPNTLLSTVCLCEREKWPLEV